ncbi:acyl-CoA/acyl-ACP dehydrogenase [Streptomyces sp. NBC_00554]|uniref:acyl-CoA dehydrogenase family protein n=1 Tax=Streptomyces sp. NBC_00554 TaxID=2903661 RepID=UPI00352C4B73|nr:acyl-CoA/acyl-ACP dehydrogenase [Streptomyces sp. NBC_00554]
MDLLPTADQEAVIASAAEFLAKEMPISSLRERAGEAEAFDRASWQQAARLGWFGLGLPEEQGGVGYTAAEEALLFREIGRHLAPGPFVATVLGAHIAAAAGRDDLVEAITAGEIVVGTAQRRVGARAATGPEASGGLEVVSGDFDLIDTTGAALVAVVEPQGAVLLETAAFGIPRQLPPIDPGIRLATASVHRQPALVSVGPDLEPAFLRGSVLVAALQTGIAEAARDLAVEHAKNRVQFGRPIGVNQAVKHRCADMAVRAEAARAQLLFAALALAEDRPDAEFHAAAARTVSADAALRNTSENIQIHGGMGYTHEHDAQLYAKRARVLDQLLVSSRETLQLISSLTASAVRAEATEPTASTPSAEPSAQTPAGAGR